MKRTLETLADRGCWISDDRVYAFVTAAGGISEIGYHGTQPVSRNSRILVRPEGAVLFSYRPAGGVERSLEFHEVDWNPGHLVATPLIPEGRFAVTIRASGRQVQVGWEGRATAPVSLIVRVWKEGCYADVQGERKWRPARVEHDAVFLACRDTIRLRSWLARTGPYSGDFLIPEPWRRLLFSRQVRSGQATPDDLRPEFRDADPLLYDAQIAVSFGGDGFRLTDEPLAWVFEHPVAGHSPVSAQFVIACGETLGKPEKIRTYPPAPAKSPGTRQSPSLSLKGFPAWESFFDSVPGLVDSCIVQDFGVPRACPGRYYWLWAWDMLVTAPEAARWGDRGLGERVARFVDSHRDANGVIPARWTRSLLPLDTPSPGSIEFLYGALAYENFLESGSLQNLRDALPNLRDLFLRVSAGPRGSGILRGEGFYPDLLAAFGRSAQSAVSMEVASWYSLCRIMGNIAAQAGDESTRLLADESAATIARTFLERFWDEGAGFLVDAVDQPEGGRSRYHPLFALLFLQSALGFSLIRGKVRQAARFVDEHLLTEHGIRSIPPAESAAGGEPVLDSWYPHWDLYALKLLRRAGNAGGIMRWLRRSEETLSRLGYCPEFLAIRPFREGDREPWTHHGAASNLNCVTGWYRAVRECVCGVESDPGGLTHIPLALPLGRVAIQDFCWRGGDWTIEIHYDGPHFLGMQVDGVQVAGCLKVPARFAGPGRHHLQVRYGAGEPGAYFGELLNAEVWAAAAPDGVPAVGVNGLGYVDGTFYSPGPAGVSVDGDAIPSTWDRASGCGTFGLSLPGPHELRLTPGKSVGKQGY